MGVYAWAIFVGGLVLLVVGAELVLRGASRLARVLGLEPMVIGLTVVSVGTSMPELAVGIAASWEGAGTLAVGNIAGTNLFNILFILGLSAWIKPLPLQALSIRLDLPVMIAAAVAMFVMALDGVLSRFEGCLMLLSSLVYTVVLLRMARRAPDPTQPAASEVSDVVVSRRARTLARFRDVAMLVVGFIVILVGADLLVQGAVDIARALGVSDAIIGLTIVAIGTSAPEFATTLIATLRDERDIAVGNLLGSSIFNILFILGATCVASPSGILVDQAVLLIDIPLAVGVAVLCVPVFLSDRMVSRREGAFFVLGYLVYLVTLLLLRV
ncbi:calcium/sodium antiporter [Polyangium sorediatum]|uniref:Calcium/sodium antiporter n=1 Tax=Polyangium sorediatum TaxID=889274 RepID=A0ABT6P7G6_9BACT|nr:calcium/sodium antiporter [Polyangium sorediatum]MDI1436566.1 calcium/sodium antiporter [Polyangium sorediatum]